MSRTLFTILLVCLSGFMLTKAQTPFTGTIKYAVQLSKVDEEDFSNAMFVVYSTRYMKIWPDTRDTAYEDYGNELLADYATGYFYEINHKQKRIIKLTTKTPPHPVPKLAPLSDPIIRIIGFRASPHQYQSENEKFKVWLADSIYINTPAFIKSSKDIFILTQDKLMLKTEQSKIGASEPEVTITAISITPSDALESQPLFPTGYTQMDDTEVQEVQNSLLQEFKRVDSVLTVTVEASHSVPPPPPPPPPKKPMSTVEKGKKVNTTKGRRNINSRKIV